MGVGARPCPGVGTEISPASAVGIARSETPDVPLILAFTEGGRLKARGFLLTPNLERLEALDLDEFRVFQVPLTDIEQRAQRTCRSRRKR